MLVGNGIEICYGKIKAIRGVSLKVSKGSIVALLGANGAGKTTTLLGISRLLPLSAGLIEFEGNSINDISPEKVVQLGISQVPQEREIFPEMTVQTNLEMGAYIRKDKKGIENDFQRVFRLFPALEKRRQQEAGTLSGGEQQMLAIGRALMSKPKLLLLDEPSLGLAPFLVREIFAAIKEINGEGVTILLVEQNAKAAFKISDYGYVIEDGKVVLEDKITNLLNNEKVKHSYLGTG